ncbi:MAG: chromate efflux transporter [Pseudomonadota bacterium]
MASETTVPVSAETEEPGYGDLFATFGRIGCLSFGGPAAQIALMEEELVTRRAWLTHDTFLRALSFCMLLPGPEAMQLATYAGWRLKGIWGGVLAGSLFVLPGAAVIFALAAAYIAYGDLPLIEQAFLGIQATVIIVVFGALKKLASKALDGRNGITLAVLAFVAIFFIGLPFPLIILAAGAYGWMTAEAKTPTAASQVTAPRPATLAAWAALWGLPIAAFWIVGATFLLTLSLFFAQLAVVTFGGAYAVLAYMTQAVVQDFGWISTDAMIDALGLAETTPGPLILVTQFVGILAGHAVGGWPLAIAAGLVTLWVTFIPCFLWIFAGAPYIERLTENPRIAAALRAVTAAVVGVIANLSIWFAIHVFFADVSNMAFALTSLPLPDLGSVRFNALLLAGFAAALMLWRGLSILPTLGLTTVAALILALAG